jgi:AcrR family transcriptional regulator
MSPDTPTRGEQTRSAILQAAHDLFVEQGYHGTSMRQIASQAGIALGGLYNHFPSKEAVFEAVFFAYHPYHEVLPYIQQAQGATVEAVIRDAAQRMVDAVRGRPDFLNLMFIEVVEFKSIHTQKLINTLFPVGLEIVGRLATIEPGRLRSLPPPMLVRSFLGLFFSYFLTEIVFATADPAEFRQDAMAHFVDIYLHGILKPPAETTGK